MQVRRSKSSSREMICDRISGMKKILWGCGVGRMRRFIVAVVVVVVVREVYAIYVVDGRLGWGSMSCRCGRRVGVDERDSLAILCVGANFEGECESSIGASMVEVTQYRIVKVQSHQRVADHSYSPCF